MAVYYRATNIHYYTLMRENNRPLLPAHRILRIPRPWHILGAANIALSNAQFTCLVLALGALLYSRHKSELRYLEFTWDSHSHAFTQCTQLETYSSHSHRITPLSCCVCSVDMESCVFLNAFYYFGDTVLRAPFLADFVKQRPVLLSLHSPSTPESGRTYHSHISHKHVDTPT